jgi:hypothetical protein
MKNLFTMVEYYPCEIPLRIISQYFENTFGINLTTEQIISFSIHTSGTELPWRVNGVYLYRGLPTSKSEIPMEHARKLDEIQLKNPKVNKALLLTLIINSRASLMPKTEPKPKIYFDLKEVKQSQSHLQSTSV